MKIVRTMAFIIGVFGAGAAKASGVVPVFDDESFRIGLTLPFIVTAVKDDPESRIHRVTAENAEGNPSCLALPDPKISANFVAKCDEVGKVRFKILIAEGERLSELTYGPIEIKELKVGYREPVDPTGPGADPDIVAGKNILFSKAMPAQYGGMTCIGCHSTPAKYPGIKTATVLKLRTISTDSILRQKMPNVPSLTESEANKVYKYLNSFSGMDEWP